MRKLDEWDLKIAGLIPWGKGEYAAYIFFFVFFRLLGVSVIAAIFWGVYRLVVR